MAGCQQYCMQWNSFPDSITGALQSLREEEMFVDVTIACDGESIKAHKLILSAGSVYFRRLLKDNPCNHPIILLRDIRLWEMQALLSFMYHGKVMIDEDKLPQLLQTAELLEIRGLSDVGKTRDESPPKQEEPCKKHALEEPDVLPNAKKVRPVPQLHALTPQRSIESTPEEKEPGPSSNHEDSSKSSLNSEETVQIKEEAEDFDEGLETYENNGDFDPMTMMVATADLQACHDQAQNDRLALVPFSTHLVPAYDVPHRKLAFHEPRPCPTCNRIYRDAATLRTHTAIMHTESIDPFKCHCGAEFPTKYEMHMHRKNRHK